ncbi:hypothetical protein PHLGIDRAFT_124666 [Phlebiopsis gigantea 11061_1 CR5-6]|uniref:Methyltransferase domain-containing protein n=1 Tax=Phlebiopsis gigantea (strain 11061_1 CR5-6) TaxID=745531 RepID=A0A0C3PVB8_PHLG1|nr:hypothetical protein PHLGIDRAFT_124666 [Phlebiopsis gigantea 11061_1 CR5-6]
MDKEQELRPSHQQPSSSVDLPPPMSRRPTAHRTQSSTSHLSQDMKRSVVISEPISSQSSWDVEALGSPPRKAATDTSRPPTPLLTRSFSGRLLSRSSSTSSRKASRTPELFGNKILSRSNSVSSRTGSLRAARTPELYHGESEESESWPGTPRTCLSPTHGLPAVSTTPSPPPVSASTACEEPGRKSWESHISREDAEARAEREQFAYQRGHIYHHRFPREEVPYMQSYSDMSLQNDISTHEFLRKLMPEGSPTFYEYCGQVPTEVLDLGCGRGTWAAETAAMWKYRNCHVTAFDVVDLGRIVRQSLDQEISAHVLWVQGNFLKALPFPSSTFGLVRIACLSLAVPMEFWHHLLQEVRRVLKPGGRLELIDDEVFFPEAQFPFGRPQPIDRSRMKPTRTLSTDNGPDVEEQPSRPPMRRSPTAHAGSQTYARGDPQSIRQKQDDFNLTALAAYNMETIFKTMLLSKYNISHRPHEFIETLMISVFGNGRANCMFRAEIVVPTSDAFLDKGKGKSVLGPSRFTSRPSNSANTGRHSLDDAEPYSRSSAGVAPKAMRVLGGGGSTATPCLPAPPYQPPGFIILPNTFVPCEPDALEMYACKNMHTLLSCKHALAGYVQEKTSPAGKPLITDAEFEELSWTYDRFKRLRFNWPETYPGCNLDEEVSPSSATRPLFNRPDGSIFGRRRVPSGANAAQHVLAMPPRRDEVIPIRTVRVYQGFKSGPGVDSVQLIPLPGRLED